jgi:hypothetical protein
MAGERVANSANLSSLEEISFSQEGLWCGLKEKRLIKG